MTNKEAIEELKYLQENPDSLTRGTAICILCELLISLGHKDVVLEYSKVEQACSNQEM